MSRTYVVTGSGSGIGKKTAELLRERGDKVVGIDLKGGEIEADLSTPEGREAAAAKAIELSDGKFDAIIACAGISAPIPKTVSINFFGVVELIAKLRPTLAKSEAPRISVVSSMATLQTVSPEMVEAMLAGDEAKALEIAASFLDENDQMAGYIAYPSSKRALSRWVRRVCITDEYAGAGIAVNAVAPAAVLTPMTKGLVDTEEGRELLAKTTPMPLNGFQPAETIANALIWLTEESNTHCTGQTIYVDGGCDASLRGDDIWSWND
ncbi:SDR family oxidoreductase [Actinobaculum suis]|uniref:SDR family oxidoreductase n=1 Tax=Actinobaculum suis TaxID=1657 RepID=UPI0008087026|nr:SDR family oxidoreductase [Actinobaculum suis]OCA95149.1 short-chain dehydrogenase [Actinobaculum suis]OCA95616.1 short-chain dehydrogenase [Actinobaculum suis]